MFSEILSELLKENRINALVLAKEIGVPKSIVYEWKNGIREPSMENMLKLSDYFGVSLEYLNGREYSDSSSKEEKELLVLLRAARNISEDDHNVLVNSFKANLDGYIKANSFDDDRKKQISELAVSLLLDQEPEGEFALSFLDMRKIKLNGKAVIESISSYEEAVGIILPVRTDGITVKVGELNLILYDDKAENKKRINWTIAHELGHILLCHSDNSRRSQLEADAFAASLLMPEAVIRYIENKNGKKMNAKEMETVFPASLTACQKRCTELNSDKAYKYSQSEKELIKKLFG